MLFISLLSAIGSVVIYVGILKEFSTESHKYYIEVIDSMPAGSVFRSFIPLATAIIVICFDIYYLMQTNRRR